MNCSRVLKPSQKAQAASTIEVRQSEDREAGAEVLASGPHVGSSPRSLVGSWPPESLCRTRELESIDSDVEDYEPDHIAGTVLPDDGKLRDHATGMSLPSCYNAASPVHCRLVHVDGNIAYKPDSEHCLPDNITRVGSASTTGPSTKRIYQSRLALYTTLLVTKSI